MEPRRHARRSPRPARARRSTSATKGRIDPSPPWSPIPRSTRSGSAAPITRASRTSRRSSTPIARGKGTLAGIACEKPLGAERRGGEADHRAREARAASTTGYLENQLFAPQVEARTQLLWARGAATHRPPLPRARRRGAQRAAHAPGSGNGTLQGGGVLNDMMCHSARSGAAPAHQARRAARVAEPGARSPRTSQSLKWSRPAYVKRSRTRWAGVDYATAPVRGLRQRR